MQNSLKLSAKDENSLGKTVTTRELAEMLGVEKRTIQETANRLLSANVLSHLETKSVVGGKTFVFDEEQATLIKQEIQKHHNLAGRQIDNVSTDLEILANASKAFSDLQELYKRKEAEYRAIIEEQKPKALVYDKICNADGLKSVEQVASNLGWGKNNFFALMRGMGIFFYSSKDADGRKVNLPKREYVERGYFVTKEEPYTRGDKDLLYTKIYVTGKGETWLANKLNEAVEDSAEKIIEKDIARRAGENVRQAVEDYYRIGRAE